MKWIYLMENSDSVKALYRWQGRNQTSCASSCLLRLSIRTQAEGFCFSETCDRFETRWWWWCAGSEGRVGEGGRGVKHLYEKTGRQTREKNDKKKRSRSPQEKIEAWTFTKNSETHGWYDADVCTTAVLRTHEGQNGTYRSAPDPSTPETHTCPDWRQICDLLCECLFLWETLCLVFKCVCVRVWSSLVINLLCLACVTLPEALRRHTCSREIFFLVCVCVWIRFSRCC